jgi:hypothetical protein
MMTVRRSKKWNVIVKWSSISFSHWQCPSHRGFSFPHFLGLLILNPCLWQYDGIKYFVSFIRKCSTGCKLYLKINYQFWCIQTIHNFRLNLAEGQEVGAGEIITNKSYISVLYLRRRDEFGIGHVRGCTRVLRGVVSGVQPAARQAVHNI